MKNLLSWMSHRKKGSNINFNRFLRNSRIVRGGIMLFISIVIHRWRHVIPPNLMKLRQNPVMVVEVQMVR